jgi:hypothetical protein
MFGDIPTYRGFISGSSIYWTSADPTPVGASDICLLPLRSNPAIISPFEVPGLLMWYRSDYGLLFDTSNRVQSWLDMSGNRFHAGQGTSTSRPFFSGSVSQFNDRPGVVFLGAQFLTASHDPRQNPNMMVIFLRGTMDTGWNTYSTFISKTSGGSWSDGWAMGSRDAPTANSFWKNSWAYVAQFSHSIPANILAVGRGGTQLTYRSNRVNRVTAATGSSPGTANVITIGGAPTSNYPALGKICEIIIYNRALLDQEVFDVEAYLTAKYGQGNQ